MELLSTLILLITGILLAGLLISLLSVPLRRMLKLLRPLPNASV